MLQEARDEVISADQKASVILAVLGLGFGATLSGVVAGEWHPSRLPPWSQVMWWSGLAAGALAVYFAGSAVWPRYTSADVSSGVHYWGHAAEFSSLTGLAEALDGQQIDIVARTRHQFWRLSHVVARKFHRIRLAMGFGVTGAILALASTVSS